MIRTLLDRVDIYMVVLVLVTVYALLVGDVRYFSREENKIAVRQSWILGIGMLALVLGAYIIKLIWF